MAESVLDLLVADHREAVAAWKKVAPTRPHPSAPNSALLHLTVGPGVGLVDRLRDALSSRAS